MLIWEYGIPVPIKHIADPTLHSMPAVAKTPNDKWMVCQNLDNQLTVYSAQDRFKLNRKKCFKGHVVAGYACQPGVSPDGNYVMSGDCDGRLWFWDWKCARLAPGLALCGAYANRSPSPYSPDVCAALERHHGHPMLYFACIVLGAQVVQGLPQAQVPRPGLHRRALAPLRAFGCRDGLVGRHDQVLGLTCRGMTHRTLIT